jgi:hypothetical protein
MSEVCEADKQQKNGFIFAVNGLLLCLLAFSPTPLPPPPCHTWMWVKNAVAVRDSLHCLTNFSGIGLF